MKKKQENTPPKKAIEIAKRLGESIITDFKIEFLEEDLDDDEMKEIIKNGGLDAWVNWGRDRFIEDMDSSKILDDWGDYLMEVFIEAYEKSQE